MELQQSQQIGNPRIQRDGEYLELLSRHLPDVLSRSQPDLVVYLAGADPHKGDALGRLGLSFEGLARRDSFVIQLCREVGLPFTITVAGGYGRNIDDTVRIHTETARIASLAMSPQLTR